MSVNMGHRVPKKNSPPTDVMLNYPLNFKPVSLLLTTQGLASVLLFEASVTRF